MDVNGLLNMVGLRTRVGGASTGVNYLQERVSDRVFDLTDNLGVSESISPVELRIINKLRDILPEDTLKSFFIEAGTYKSSTLTTSQQQSDKIMILLNQLFFNIMKGIYAHVKEDREKSRFDKQALGEVNKDTVLKYCLDINFPAKQDKLGFISGSKHEKIDVSELSKDFFLLHYLKSIETILANFCLGGLFTAIISYKEFFDETLVARIEGLEKKYGKGSGSEHKVSMTVWDDVIAILADLQLAGSAPLTEKLIELFTIYRTVVCYLTGSLDKAAMSTHRNIIINDSTSKSLFSLIAYSIRSIKSLKDDDFGSLLNDVVTKRIFGKEIDKADATILSHSPFWQSLYKSKVGPEAKRVIGNILVENKHIFLIDKPVLGADLFAQILLYSEDIKKLHDIQVFFTLKKTRKIHPENYKTIIELDLETSEMIHSPKLLSLVSEIRKSGVDKSKLKNLSPEAWEIIEGGENPIELFHFFSAHSENIADYERNLGVLREVEDDLHYLPLSYGGMSEMRGFLAANILVSNKELERQKRKLYSKDFPPFGSIGELVSLNRELLFYYSKQKGAELLEYFYIGLSHLGKKPRRKLLRKIFNSGILPTDFELVGKVVLCLPNSFKLDDLISNIHEFIPLAREHKVVEEARSEDVAGLTQMLLSEIGKTGGKVAVKKTKIEGAEGADEVYNFSPSVHDQLKGVFGGGYHARADFKEFLEAVSESVGILNGIKDYFIDWILSAGKSNYPTIEHIDRIHDFFDFLHKKMRIPFVERPEKIFAFLGTMSSEDFQIRKSKLYSTFRNPEEFKQEDFDGFRGVVLRFMKNGNDEILSDFVAHQEDQEVENLEGDDTENLRLLPHSFSRMEKKVIHFGFKFKGISGGHHIYERDGTAFALAFSHRKTISKGIMARFMRLLRDKYGIEREEFLRLEV